VSFFWDIENVPIPRGQKPFDIVQCIRQKLVLEPGLQEEDFFCYCNINTISRENQQSLHHATVRIFLVPDRKPGGVDRQIMLDLDRFAQRHRPPDTVVLISGDIDFVGKLSDLRHRAGFHVILIHNESAKQELKATANEHYPWELFTNTQAISLTGRPYFNNNQSAYDNRSSQSTSKRGRSRRSTADSWNNDNFVHRNTLTSSTSPLPLMQQQSIRTIQQRQVDSVPSFTSDINQSSFPVYYFNGVNNVPHYPSSSTMLPKTSVRRSASDSHFEPNNIPFNAMGRGTNRANRKTTRERNTSRDCPFCKAEFDTIQALRQHQEDTDHIYGCQVCNQGFFTHEGQIQHSKAKGHDICEDTDSSTENYSSYRSRNENESDDEDSDTADNTSTNSGKNGANEPVSGMVVIRGLIEIARELFK
jgi:hypothetical protein